MPSNNSNNSSLNNNCDRLLDSSLGTEKYKSKVVHKTLNPVWLEQFDLHLYEDPYLGQELEVTVWDRDKSHQDDLMGKTVIDLATLERETTHRLWRDLEDGSGNIFLLLTISGTTASETISDLAAHEETPREREQLYQRYSMRNTLQRLRDVGHLTVKVCQISHFFFFCFLVFKIREKIWENFLLQKYSFRLC